MKTKIEKSDAEESVKPEKSITEIVALQLGGLNATYAKAVAPLEKERLTLESDSQELQTKADQLKRLLAAAARRAERDADDLLLAGKGEEAQAKRDEQQQAERGPAELAQRQREIAARLEEIEAEKRDTARRVFKEWFEELRTPLVEEQRTLVEALDNAWAGIQTFAQETGGHQWNCPLITSTTRGDLTAREHGEEKATFLRLLEWFGLGGRQ